MKILASDFDDTIFFEKDEEKTKNNIAAIKKFVAAGNLFCLITGRNYTFIKQFTTKHNIKYTYLICEDGAIFFNNVDYCLKTIHLNKKVIHEIEEEFKKINCDYYLEDGYNKTEYLDDVVKMVVNCTDDKTKKYIVELLKEKFNVHIYASRNHVNIINESVNKKNALEELIKMEKLNRKDLYVIGDNDNDYDMLANFQGAVVKEHHKVLDKLQMRQVDSLSDYIEELMQN